MSFFAQIFQNFINVLGASISALLSVLPSSPFTWSISEVDSSAFKIFMWLVPVADFVTIMATYVAAVALYYSLRIVLRWIKVVGS